MSKAVNCSTNEGKQTMKTRTAWKNRRTEGIGSAVRAKGQGVRDPLLDFTNLVASRIKAVQQQNQKPKGESRETTPTKHSSTHLPRLVPMGVPSITAFSTIPSPRPSGAAAKASKQLKTTLSAGGCSRCGGGGKGEGQGRDI